MITRICQDLPAFEVLATTLANSYPSDKNIVYLLQGDLGAGKTTLSQLILRAWGVTDNITSPTFNIVNVYQTTRFKAIAHFDLYRLEPGELSATGLDEYWFRAQGPCLIEWPERLEPEEHPTHSITITIKIVEDDAREVTITSTPKLGNLLELLIV
jgi:tRNA threonylcarbamoyladenosine biosynthesis protein TsaE